MSRNAIGSMQLPKPAEQSAVHRFSHLRLVKEWPKIYPTKCTTSAATVLTAWIAWSLGRPSHASSIASPTASQTLIVPLAHQE
jgi:hypothetical protein